jgi:AraC family transcriptional regulator, transcriptional activator of pobA
MKQLDKTLDINGAIKHLLPMKTNAFYNYPEIAVPFSDGGNNIVIIKHTGGDINRLPVRTDHFVLVLCLEGTAHRSVNQHHFRLTPGNLHLVRPRVLNAYHETSEDLQLHMIFFKQEFLADNMMREAHLNDLFDKSAGKVPYRLLNEESFDRIKALFAKLDDEVNTQKLFHGQMLKLIFIELLLEAGRLCGNEAEHFASMNRPQQLNARFKKLVEEKFLQLKTVQEYADLLFVTPKHLSEVIRNETGLNPLHLIHNRQFQDAKYWLCASELSVKEISDKLNFDTASHFSRFFKQFTGYHPTQFRRIQCAI